MIYILPVKEQFQVLLRYEYTWSANLAKCGLHGRNIYDGCCRLDIEFISKDFLDKSESYCGMYEDSWSAFKLRSIFIDLMIESLHLPSSFASVGVHQTSKLMEVPCSPEEEAKYSAEEEYIHLERQVFDEIPVKEYKEIVPEEIDAQVFDEITDTKVESLTEKEDKESEGNFLNIFSRNLEWSKGHLLVSSLAQFDCKSWIAKSKNDILDNESNDLGWNSMETKRICMSFAAESNFIGDLEVNRSWTRPLPKPPPLPCSIVKFRCCHGPEHATSRVDRMGTKGLNSELAHNLKRFSKIQKLKSTTGVTEKLAQLEGFIPRVILTAYLLNLGELKTKFNEVCNPMGQGYFLYLLNANRYLQVWDPGILAIKNLNPTEENWKFALCVPIIGVRGFILMGYLGE